jgi:hypothetical protein
MMPYNLAGSRIEKSLKAKFQALNDRLSKLVRGDANSDARDLQVRRASSLAGFAAWHFCAGALLNDSHNATPRHSAQTTS